LQLLSPSGCAKAARQTPIKISQFRPTSNNDHSEYRHQRHRMDAPETPDGLTPFRADQ
jgi:hypothetical protein